MVSPNNKAQQTDSSHSINYTVLAESLSPHVVHDYVRQKAKTWKNKDVDFRMPKEPEEVLEQNRVPSPPWIEKSGVEVPV